YHNYVPVADIEESVVLINVSTPAPQEVAPQVDEQRKDLLIPSRVAAMKGIRGHPVGPLDQNSNSVHLEEKLSGLLDARRFGPNQLDLADSHGVPPRGENLIAIEQLGCYMVKAGNAIASRPPKPGVLNLDLKASRRELHLMDPGKRRITAAGKAARGLSRVHMRRSAWLGPCPGGRL